MRILFCGGGTAGHVYPNIAIAEAFKKNNSNVELAYVATLNGIENELVPFKKYQINAVGLKRKITIENFKFFYRLIESIKQSEKIIKSFSPDVIIGTGGYATFPVIYAGHKLGIKTVLHESNLVPGRAIKQLEKKADIIFVNFKESIEYFKNKEKIFHVGNPLRQGYYSIEKQLSRNKLEIKHKNVILCFGGSLGAEKINNAAICLVEDFIKQRNDTLFLWATGKKDFARVIDVLKYKGLDKIKNVIVSDYIYDMPSYLSASDIVICRAGAMTLSELALCQKCAVLIPSPNVTNNHQYKNAKALYDKGAASLIKEEEINKLTDEIKDLVDNDQKRKNMENKITKFSVKNANKRIYEKIIDLIS